MHVKIIIMHAIIMHVIIIIITRLRCRQNAITKSPRSVLMLLLTLRTYEKEMLLLHSLLTYGGHVASLVIFRPVV